MTKILKVIPLFILLFALFSCTKNTTNIIVQKKLKDFEVRLKDKEFEYDGLSHHLEAEGDIPDGTIITWTNNEIEDVGERVVLLNLKNEEYNEITLKATLKIIGKDFDESLSLVESNLDTKYNEEVSFVLNDLSKLPSEYNLNETYINKETGEMYDSFPNAGGSFRYILALNAKGYNTKYFYGDLNIERPHAERIEITNYPKIIGEVTLLNGFTWTPEYEIYPKGSIEDEIELYSMNESIVAIDDGSFKAINYGICEIGIKIKNTTISTSKFMKVKDSNYAFEDFETEKVLYNGNTVREDDITYYGAAPAVSAFGKIESDGENHYLRISGSQNYDPYYSFVEIKMDPSKGWTPGVYHIEFDVEGTYDFIFYWTRNDIDDPTYYNMAISGARSNGSAIIENGKISINFRIQESDLGNLNSIRFAQGTANAFDFIIDNILIIKVE